MPGRRWRWLALALVVLLVAFTARYVSIGPEEHHTFDVGGGKQELLLVSPTLLGWIGPGDRTSIESVQFSPDGRWMYVYATRGVGDQLASVSLSRPQDGVLVVDVRLITIPSPGRSAVGLSFATRVWLDPPLWVGIPPITIDASTGRSVVIGSWIP